MASKSNGLETDWARAPPPSGSVWQRLGKAVYDPEDKSFLGRTPKRWGIVLIFYAVFYAVLAAMFAICMAGLFYQLDDNKPYYTLQQSLIGASPGVDYRPRPADGVAVEYDISNSTALARYTTELEEFLKPYQNEKWFTTKKECNADDNYGFPATPCLYIKLNKIYGWKPEYHEVAALPADMSADLIEYINTLEEADRQQVWVSCWTEGGNATLEYPWGRGLPARFYPYSNQDDYRSPLVAVRVTPPVNSRVVVRCRAWARNVVYNKSIKEAAGYARIIIQVDDRLQDAAAAADQ